MAVTVRKIRSTPPDQVLCNTTPLTTPQDENRQVSGTDVIATTGPSASVEIASDGVAAAFVQGPNSSTTVFCPPSYGLYRIYYNNSYRYKLTTPGGYVGIRG